MLGSIAAGAAGLLLLVGAAFAQEVEPVNRVPIGDAEFALIADHFGYDRAAPLDASVIGVWPHRNPYITEKIEFSGIRGERVRAFYTHPKDSTGARHPAVLLLHGMNDFWGKHEDWALEWMDILSREGWCVLVADFHGFGERKKADQPDPWSIGPYSGRDALVQCVSDQRRGIDLLFTRTEVDTTRIALMGGSMGGRYGVLVAGLEERLKAVVLTVTGAWGSEATDDPFGRFGHTLNFAPRISAPVFMMNATGDGRESGTELFRAMPEPKEQVWVESNHYLPPRQHNREILDWLHRQLD